MKKVMFGLKSVFGIESAQDQHGILGNETVPKGQEHQVPQATPWYQFQKELIKKVMVIFAIIGRGKSRPGIWVKGPTGTGKSSLILELAARLNQPVQHVVFHEHLEYHELLGMQAIVDGETLYLPGPLVDAVRYGQWFLGDEIDLASPGTLTALNGILDGRSLTLPENGGEVVPLHPDTRFFFTANTGGSGDRTGLYAGTRPQNTALRNRCVAIEVDYLPRETELAILQATTPDLPDFIREKLVDAAKAVRDIFLGKIAAEGEEGAFEMANGVSAVISTRTLVTWAEATSLCSDMARQGVVPWEYALNLCLLDGLDDPQEKTNIREVVQRVMGEVAP